MSEVKLSDLQYIIKKRDSQPTRDQALKVLNQRRVNRFMASNRPTGWSK